jgi:chromosomal replication initiator protein
VQNNIRELEGALNRVIAHVQLTNTSLNVETARAALADLVTRPTSSLSLDEVLHVIADFYHLSVEDLANRSRSKELVKPRQVAMYMAREELQATLPQIGEALGGRDHTTVMYGVEKIAREVEQDDGLRREIVMIREKLYNRNGARA